MAKAPIRGLGAFTNKGVNRVRGFSSPDTIIAEKEWHFFPYFSASL